MSAPRDTGAKTTIYVRLLGEGTDVWRPVAATELPDGTFQLAERDTGCDSETWEFPPRARVRCVLRTFSDGSEGLVAVGYAG